MMRHVLLAYVSGVALSLAGTVLGSDPEGAANLAARGELPAGNGLAAQFPDDVGLRTNADVIFVDDHNVVVARRYIGPTGRKGTVTVRPEDNGQALVNPDMGWTMHFFLERNSVL